MALWKRVAPLVRAGKLKALFLEASFADPRDDAKLFGHLTPRWIVRELFALAAETGASNSLREVTVVITHLKPSLDSAEDVRVRVREQLKPLTALGITVVVPEPGQRVFF